MKIQLLLSLIALGFTLGEPIPKQALSQRQADDNSSGPKLCETWAEQMKDLQAQVSVQEGNGDLTLLKYASEIPSNTGLPQWYDKLIKSERSKYADCRPSSTTVIYYVTPVTDTVANDYRPSGCPSVPSQGKYSTQY